MLLSSQPRPVMDGWMPVIMESIYKVIDCRTEILCVVFSSRHLRPHATGFLKRKSQTDLLKHSKSSSFQLVLGAVKSW